MTGERVQLTDEELGYIWTAGGHPTRLADRVERILAEHTAALTQERDEARAVVEAVRALHKPLSTYVGPDFCRTCSDLAHEWVPWPCPTGVLPPPTAPTAEALGEAGTGGGQDV